MLARLDGVAGVERSYVNRSGTLLRLSVAPSADPDGVAAEVVRVLGEEREPTRLAGQGLEEALAQEEWRDAGRVGELSAIEYRTLALRLLLLLAAVAAVWAIVRRARRRRKDSRAGGLTGAGA